MTDSGTIHSTVRTPGWQSTPALTNGLAVLATAGAFWWLDGLTGVVLAAGIGLALFVLPVVFVFALAQVALAVSLPGEPALVAVVVGELPLVVLLGTTLDQAFSGMNRDWEWSGRRAGIVALLGGGALGGTLLAVATVQQLWLGALLIGGVVALVAYGVHRYTVVVFDGDVDE